MRNVLIVGCVILLLLAGCDGVQPATRGAPDAVATPAPAVHATQAAAPVTVYRWDAEHATVPPGGPLRSQAVRLADGQTAQRLGTTGGGWNILIAVPRGILQGGQAYQAELAYEVVAPPAYPGTFHMFARSASLGQERDVWLNWLGDAGDRGTARLPMELAAADDWTFSVGCKGPAEIIIERFAITAGTGFVFTPASETAVAAAADPGPVAQGCADVAITPPAPGNGLVVSAAEFGLTADGAGGAVAPEVAAANALALHRALAACRARSASRLTIPPGTYHLNPKDPIAIEDQHDLVIDGQGAELVFTKLLRNVAALNLRNCARVAIRDLRIDWDWTTMPIASLAQVATLAPDRRSCRMVFPDLDAAAVARVKSAPWMAIMPVDPATFLLTDALRIIPKVEHCESAGADALDVTFAAALPLVPGQHYLVRHLYYEMGAFKMSDCSQLQFERVTIHSMPGMGWIGRGDLDHIALRDCSIVPRPGTRQPMTTAADGFHILDSQGGILISGCEFTRTGDDCINIHDNCCQGVRKTAASTLVLVNNPRFRMKAAVGDHLELFRADYAPVGYTGTVTTVAYDGNDTVVGFAEPLPEAVSPLSIVCNRRYGTCDVRVERSRFSHGRVMLSARRATIEDCIFDHPFANAVQLHTEIVGNLWAEGCGASDIVIRRNLFRDVNLRGKFGGAVIYGVPVLPAGRTSQPIFRDILIEDNRFIDSRGPAVHLGASQGVVVRGNRFEADAPVPGANARAGCLLAECSRDLRLGGNTWKRGSGQAKPGVLFDPATTSGVVVDGNRMVGE